MLRFAVYDESGPASTWPLSHAYLVGPDDLAVAGEITFRDGQVRCKKRGSQATGLALMYDAGRAGQLCLQTCLLPDADRPYALSHELARYQIKTFLIKSEEWQMFEQPADQAASTLWEQARQLFTEGLNAREPVDQDRLGRAALERAIDANERLAMAHASILLHRRYATKPASETTLGVRVPSHLSPKPFVDLLSREFDIIYIPLRWRDMEPAEGRYDWRPIDEWMQWAHKNGCPIVAGPLLDFSQASLPDWMHVWQHDYDTCRDMAYDHIERVVHRYQKYVSIWSIAAGLNVNASFHFTIAQMLDLTRMVNLLIRQDRRGRTMLEIVQPFGEHVATNKDSIPPLTYIDRVVQEGIRVNCYGLQLAMGGGPEGLPARDLMQLSHQLDRFFLLELPVLITSVGVPSHDKQDSSGHWQGGWSADEQARWVARFFGLGMSKPHVESFIWSELIDHARAGVPGSGLIDQSGNPKPVLKRLVDMRRRLRKPLGALKS